MKSIKSVKGVEIAVDAIESVGPPRKVTSKTPETRTVTTTSGAKHDVHPWELRKLDEVTIVPAQPGFRLAGPTQYQTPIVAWAVRLLGDDDPYYVGLPVLADTSENAIELPDGRVCHDGIVYKNVDAMREALSTRREGELQ